MQPTRRSTLFLLELMMAILLFSLAATVCVQVFVKSHTLEKESSKLSQAVFASASVAEIFRSTDNYDSLLLREFPHTVSDDDCYLIFFDKDFSHVSHEDSYCLKLVTDKGTDFISGHIFVYDTANDSSLIYDLEVKKHNTKEDN